MNRLKISTFKLTMSLSIGVMAADSTNNTIGSDRDLNGNNSRESIKMQEYVGKNEDDKILCEQEVQNDKTRNMSNENSRLNPTRDRKMKDEMNSIDMHS